MSQYKNNIKNLSFTSEKTYPYNCLLKPDITSLHNQIFQIKWFRIPPKPFENETQQLTFNYNKSQYQCSCLDYQCYIECIMINQNGKQFKKYKYGPIQGAASCHYVQNSQLNVNVLLFNQMRRCILSFNPSPCIINRLNNNKYYLSYQDMNSIIPKQNTQKEMISFGIKNNYDMKTQNRIIVKNLFQRLILLKLFHQIPKGMYSYSMQLIQIVFENQIDFNIALMAFNRFKYNHHNRDNSSRDMLINNGTLEKSKKCYSNKNVILNKNQYEQSIMKDKKCDISRVLYKTFIKNSPKQSIYSNGNQSSVLSGNSNHNDKQNHNRMAFLGKNKNKINNTNSLIDKNGDNNNKIIIKQPKVSILSTEITTTKCPRDQKQSFPETPNDNLMVPDLFKARSQDAKNTIRRSQDEIKTPRMDDENFQVQNISSKKKSCSSIQKLHEQVNKKQIQYVDEFETLLYQQQQGYDNQLLCLNDSFAKFEQNQENNDKIETLQNVSNQIQHNKNNILSYQQKSFLTQSEKQMNEMKEKIICLLNQNRQLSMRNQKNRREIQESKHRSMKSQEFIKNQEELQKYKIIQQQLKKEIDELKNNYQKKRVQNKNMDRASKLQFQQQRPSGFYSPPRDSKNFENTIGQRPYFIAGRSSREYQPFISKKLNLNEVNNIQCKNQQKCQTAEDKYFKFNQERASQKFKTNQSYNNYKPLNFLLSQSTPNQS